MTGSCWVVVVELGVGSLEEGEGDGGLTCHKTRGVWQKYKAAGGAFRSCGSHQRNQFDGMNLSTQCTQCTQCTLGVYSVLVLSTDVLMY